MGKTVDSAYRIRPILPEDDARLAQIIRQNLEKKHLNIPGTAYFDPELAHLSRYYAALRQSKHSGKCTSCFVTGPTDGVFPFPASVYAPLHG